MSMLLEKLFFPIYFHNLQQSENAIINDFKSNFEHEYKYIKVKWRYGIIRSFHDNFILLTLYKLSNSDALK